MCWSLYTTSSEVEQWIESSDTEVNGSSCFYSFSQEWSQKQNIIRFPLTLFFKFFNTLQEFNHNYCAILCGMYHVSMLGLYLPPAKYKQKQISINKQT